MRISLKVFVSVALVFICLVNTSLSASPEDLEGSSNDLDNSSSGSGDWSEDEIDDTVLWTYAENEQDRTESHSDGSSVVIVGKTEWLTEHDYVILANKKTLLKNKDVLAGVVAGAVTGVILAITVAAILIYRWQRKDTEGYILAQQKASNGDYHRQNKDEVIIL